MSWVFMKVDCRGRSQCTRNRISSKEKPFKENTLKSCSLCSVCGLEISQSIKAVEKFGIGDYFKVISLQRIRQKSVQNARCSRGKLFLFES